MSRLLALELNDLGLRLAGDPALDELEPSLGWAVFEPDGIVCGGAAAASARLHPRSAHRAIWSELSAEPLPRPFPHGVSTADLAYAHLQEVWNTAKASLGTAVADLEGVLLAAPGSFSAEELGLTLGIARSLELPLTGIVDSALAAVAGAGSASGRAIHVDLELGRAVVTELESGESTSGRWVVRRRVRVERLAGWNSMLDLWAREVGRAFVSATRFDPLHTARSEQELYDSLPVWLGELGEVGTIEAVMGTSEREHRVVLTRDQVARAAASLYDRVVDGVRALAPAAGDGVLMLSHRLAVAPGLVERLRTADLGRCELLEQAAVSTGVLAHSERIHSPAGASLPRVTQLLPKSAERRERGDAS